MTRLLLKRPGLFFALVTVLLGVLGFFGLLRGRNGGTQPVHGGAVGFALGASCGLFLTLVFFALRGRARPDGWTVKLTVLGGTLAVIVLFVALTR